MSELIVIEPSQLEAGMVLAESIVMDGMVLARSGFRITEAVLDKLRALHVDSVKVYTGVPENAPPPNAPAVQAPLQGSQGQAQATTGNIPAKTFADGEYLCFQGEDSSSIFILKSGALEVIINDLPEGEHRNLTIKDVESKGKSVALISNSGATIGEIGAVLGTPRSASVRARGTASVSVVSVKGGGLEKSIMAQPRLGLNIAVTLVSRLGANNQKLFEAETAMADLQDKLDFCYRAYMTVCQDLGNAVAATGDSLLKDIHDFAKNSSLYSHGRARSGRNRLDDVETSTGLGICQDFSTQKIVTLDPGENLYMEGEPGDKMFILNSGRIGIYRGNKRVATIEGRGELIGEVEPLLGFSKNGQFPPRRESARAAMTSQAIVIQGQNLESLMTSDPNLMVHVVKCLARRLPESNTAMVAEREVLRKTIAKFSVTSEFEHLSSMMASSHLRESLSKDIQLCNLIVQNLSATIAQLQKGLDNLNS